MQGSSDDYGAALSGASVLVIDDEPGMRNFLAKIVGARVKRIEAAGSADEATRRLDEAHFDLVILDNIMPGTTGLDWVNEQQRRGLFTDVILITAYADLETAIAALRAGVSDFVLKPFRANQILGAAARALDRKHLRRDNTLLRRELLADGMKGRLLGTSPRLEEVRGLLGRLAPLSTPVLFTGASGTGKEVAARTLHDLSERALRPFVAVNCAAIAPDRIAQELFGMVGENDVHRPGLFLLADGGTLFLDEIAQIPDAFQTALLRVLEDQRIRAVGGTRDIPLDLRLMFASNTDLESAMREGRLRADLYHRINVVNVEMPLLRDRADDIVALAAFFMETFATAMGVDPLPLDEETLLKLRRYEWPGNVRELRNLVERSLILGAFPDMFEGGGVITGSRAIEDLDLVTQRHIMHILDRCDGNRAEAARRLGVSRKTIDRKVASWARP